MKIERNPTCVDDTLDGRRASHYGGTAMATWYWSTKEGDPEGYAGFRLRDNEVVGIRYVGEYVAEYSLSNPRGAGRKPKGRKASGLWLTPETLAAIQAAADQKGVSRNDAAEEVIKMGLNHGKK